VEGRAVRLCVLSAWRRGSIVVAKHATILHEARFRRVRMEFQGQDTLKRELQWRYVSSPLLRTAIKAFWLISTLPIAFIRFLPSFCFCSNFRFRVMSPP